MVLALNVSVYFCKLLPLHMNGNLPVGIGMHVFAMICDLIRTLMTTTTMTRARRIRRRREHVQNMYSRTGPGHATLLTGAFTFVQAQSMRHDRQKLVQPLADQRLCGY
eukprot:UN0413